MCERLHLTGAGRLAAARRSTALRGPAQSDGSAVRRLQHSAFCRKHGANVTPLRLYCQPQSPRTHRLNTFLWGSSADCAHVRLSSDICKKLRFCSKRPEELLQNDVWQRPRFTNDAAHTRLTLFSCTITFAVSLSLIFRYIYTSFQHDLSVCIGVIPSEWKQERLLDLLSKKKSSFWSFSRAQSVFCDPI